MDSTTRILQEIEIAREAVNQASLKWNAADLARIQESLLALEQSIPGLRHSLEAIPAAGPLPAQQLRSAVRALRDEAAALEVLVDAAAAFVRSSPATPGIDLRTYNPTGELRLGPTSPVEVYTG